ncbi:cbb3-type cytochrome oxidase assembly protein CcoS [Rhodocyclus tenuis]|uniref:Cbb3-type cytochrome oxidase assembly protein CcoS n=2 Tax=Rhodocyclus TaxID=1064 RepID=A0A6L5JXT3_RHOTE|nr:cbb3-type cytochrome oxidase assembly protein CcoS [Rhodocyclus gracilis]MQY51642.1 cbb3-type cytochrome oxidase assembly protein CcoS [Rhodocyclus gracilis]MRD73123.1 cbb3-type cytochrome oxidase assembly protein CcoS [Rhodocyclus gracilis]NJA89099.1 cbb3-type cytochrome oxidase assembly protein CcoS [Rhodocyclus gracilis]
METLYLLIPVSVVLVFLIGIAFWWSLRGGQFDDLEGPAYRVLMDDDTPQQKPSPTSVVPAEPTEAAGVLGGEAEPDKKSH